MVNQHWCTILLFVDPNPRCSRVAGISDSRQSSQGGAGQGAGQTLSHELHRRCSGLRGFKVMCDRTSGIM